MRVILGCPTLRRYDLLVGMLQSAAAGTRPPDRYVVIDNGGTLWTETPKPESVRALPLLVDVPGENLGCARSWNTFAKTLLFNDDTALLLVGDDVLFRADTIGAMVDAMETQDADFVTAEPGGFSCFMVRHRLFQKIGYFDEQFWPAYYEDNDFHRRMQLSGVCKEVLVSARYDHVNKGSQTYASFNAVERMEHNKRFETNRARYVSKWGGLPHEEKFNEPYNGLESTT